MDKQNSASITKQEWQGLPFFSVVPMRARKLHKELLFPRKLTTHKLELKVCAGRHIDNARKESPQRKKLRDFDKSKTPLTLAPSTPLQSSEKLHEDHIHLHSDQAIGRIVSAQANFMRVIVLNPGERKEGLTKEHDLEGIEQAVLHHNDHVAHSRIEKASLADGMLLDESEVLDREGKLGMELLCVVRALLKKIKRRVMVGDKVLISGVDWIDGRGMIEQVLDRESEIWDPPVANVDQLLVLASLDRPRPEPLSLSRFLIEAESTGIPFTVVFNKTDLVSLEDVSDWERRLNSWGYKPLFCSAAMKLGIGSLVDILANRTSAIIGPSGVGKSSVINALCDEAGVKLWSRSCEEESTNAIDSDAVQTWSEVFEEQAVGEVSERSGRGKHTTRHVSLLKLPKAGYLADTPGFNQPGLAKVSTKSLPFLFPEIRIKLSESQCAFANCLHIGEPNCVVGGDWERYAHYLQLLEEVKKREQLEMKTFGTKRENEMRYKVKAFGVKQAEPRLVLKKHRRISRHSGKQDLAVELAEDADEVSLRED